MESLYRHWNQQINLISRKDIDNLCLHHILHSLSIARFIHFAPGTTVMDAGTGGGFPGIPLAILFPDVRFFLVDSIGKKIKAVTEIIRETQLTNAIPVNNRVESMDRSFDFITGRAVSGLEKFGMMALKKIKPKQLNEKENGILYLTGNTSEKTVFSKEAITVIPLSTYFSEAYFETKTLIYIPAKRRLHQ